MRQVVTSFPSSSLYLYQVILASNPFSLEFKTCVARMICVAGTSNGSRVDKVGIVPWVIDRIHICDAGGSLGSML